ncbi:uncharacterized protein (DUF2336 family) [Roseiarcus fermentans]|uniref:Uncharacterized protein (DUF2336 family) n=1 Tax=Roseiarcus fermentans TaxID=1473586 RepID=A0A366FRR2_9HYPH|nr:DUF2336 domain-containing protein [Roseiarcus fermentans]RBP16425.1 uncharacterized protein (DUF2336 family) [Roseiarcus fermentans]
MPTDFQPAPDLTLSGFPFVAALADSADPQDRRIWLRVACDHFVLAGRADARAIERFADAVGRQLETADRAAVLEAARKLAPCPRTPARLLDRLADADPEASDCVLEHGRAFTSADLVGAIGRGSRQALAVARRPGLDSRLIGALVARDEADILVALADNPGARLQGAVVAGLMRRARALAEDRGDRRLAESLLRRRPLGPEHAALFLLADPPQRVEILIAAQRDRLGRPRGLPAAAAPQTIEALELAAVARQPRLFVATLAKALGCGEALAQRIADDPSGEPLAVALAALGAPGEVVVRVLIAGDLAAGGAYGRIRSLARLNSALDRNAAMAVMAALCGQPARRRTDGPAEAALREPAARRRERAAIRPQRKAAG